MSIEDTASQRKVGILWFALEKEGNSAFVYDFSIYEQHRRQGFGRQALAALDEMARGLGAREIGLHVFGQNNAALSLYQQAGYVVTNINMKKSL